MVLANVEDFHYTLKLVLTIEYDAPIPVGAQVSIDNFNIVMDDERVVRVGIGNMCCVSHGDPIVHICCDHLYGDVIKYSLKDLSEMRGISNINTVIRYSDAYSNMVVSKPVKLVQFRWMIEPPFYGFESHLTPVCASVSRNLLKFVKFNVE